MSERKRPERKTPASILVVDDDAAVSKVLCALLEQEGYRATHVGSAEAGLEAMERRPVDTVVTDLKMPGMDGMAFLREVRIRWPDVPVLMLTAHGTVPLAVEAMRRGAADFILKPFDRDELLFSVKKALSSRRGEAPPPRGESEAIDAFVGAGPAMEEVRRTLERAARGRATVLIRGETGTGKEVAARALHRASPRRDAPFIKVHCGALPDTLLESELFGYEKGAFTGATGRKPGRVDLAQGGTLFLDEVGDASPVIQLKLLRLLQDREYERLGGTETLEADVRFVAATHRDLEAMVEAGAFREDLFYRLNVVPVFLPPLRARPGEIRALAQHFCRQFAEQNERPEMALSEEALVRLEAEPWPGNVRELENFVERLVVLSDGPVLTEADVERELARRPPGSVPAGQGTVKGTLEARRKEGEREAILEALERAGNNRTLAARLLVISRRTLYNKLAEYGID